MSKQRNGTEKHTRSHPFTVSQMIDALAKLPPDALLYVRGYEEGMHDATAPDKIRLTRNVNEYGPWYYGPHTAQSPYDETEAPEVGYYIAGAS